MKSLPVTHLAVIQGTLGQALCSTLCVDLMADHTSLFAETVSGYEIIIRTLFHSQIALVWKINYVVAYLYVFKLIQCSYRLKALGFESEQSDSRAPAISH